MAKTRPYLYYDHVVSLCEHCLRRIEAKQVIQDDRVWLLKWCPVHGSSKVLVASDAAYWRRAREVYLKPHEMPARFNTAMKWGCPYDCGLCPDHMQHACLSVVEITDHCNLRCPTCYAASGPARDAKIAPETGVGGGRTQVVLAQGEVAGKPVLDKLQSGIGVHGGHGDCQRSL